MTSDPKPPSGPSTTLTAEELESEQEKVRELQERIQKAAACTCLLPLGRDRLYRRYWLLPSASTLFVEDDCFGLTEDMLHPQPKPAQDATTKMEDEEVVKEEPAEGSVGSSPAPINTCGPPVKRPNQWSFYSSVEEVDQLIEALNPRDDPESSRSVPECTAAAETLMEVRLRDLLLDIEDRIHQGTLGTLKVMDRQVWRSALEAGNYELLCSDGRENGGMNARVEAMEVDSPAHLKAKDRLQELRSDGMASCSGTGSPQVVSSSVRVLAQALVHIEHGIERRFLKAPLGEEDSKKDQKTKKSKKKDEDQASDDGSDSGRISKTVLDRWRESLQSCSSLSQVFVHLSSLERSVLWSRSVLNARCRICRRKGDADNMLLCDGCDRGHHTHCLRPRLKSVPEGDCTKKSPALPPKGKNQQATPKGQQGQQATPKGQQATPKGQQATPKGQQGQQATPKGQQASAGKNSSASRSSGKKTTPPTIKANTASGGKAPARSGSRVSARLSHIILPTNGNAKTSPGQSEPCKRPLTDVTPPSKASRPILLVAAPSSSSSSSSSSRRSSGRSHGVHELSACEQLTVELVRHEDSWPFMKLVSRTQVPPPGCTGEFISDVDLMFSNCLRYNPRHTNEAKAGHRLQQFFHSELSRLGLSERGSTPPAKRSRH
ncbi:Zinc finger domain protein 1A [Collichthys lucidus]|uniref:Bromodomain adjacent to zinc finger domain protein 1A n=1 Tax=Collichthys lucidus TaxID=240159 RepID=A0A4V6ATH5_COLLU|nr:Zinc finger domain protein 1A [Collichthys lucidus]